MVYVFPLLIQLAETSLYIIVALEPFLFVKLFSHIRQKNRRNILDKDSDIHCSRRMNLKPFRIQVIEAFLDSIFYPINFESLCGILEFSHSNIVLLNESLYV